MTNGTATRPPRLGEARPAEIDASWRLDGACASRDPEDFYPEGGQRHVRQSYERARVVCAVCPVAERCLNYALDNEERHGMWGGHTPAEREDLLGRRRRQVA